MSRLYRKAERLLYTYSDRLAKLHEARLALWHIRRQTDCHAQRYDSGLHSGGSPSDPPGNYTDNVMRLEKIISDLAAITDPLTAMLKFLSLSSEERDRTMHLICELHYQQGMTFQEIASDLQKSERTIYRRRDELVKLAIKELGL